MQGVYVDPSEIDRIFSIVEKGNRYTYIAVVNKMQNTATLQDIYANKFMRQAPVATYPQSAYQRSVEGAVELNKMTATQASGLESFLTPYSDFNVTTPAPNAPTLSSEMKKQAKYK